MIKTSVKLAPPMLPFDRRRAPYKYNSEGGVTGRGRGGPPPPSCSSSGKGCGSAHMESSGHERDRGRASRALAPERALVAVCAEQRGVRIIPRTPWAPRFLGEPGTSGLWALEPLAR